MDELRHQTVDLIRPDLANGVAQLRANPAADQRARGDNFHFEENVHPNRQAEFEGFAGDTPGLLGHSADYFAERVQGPTQAHTPTTFLPINQVALLSAGFEPNQRLARLERIDQLIAERALDFEAIQTAARKGASKEAVLAPLIDGMNAYPGARPAFACFRAEIAADLAERDWLRRVIARLGLGHFLPPTGQTYRFVRMEYLAEAVITGATVTRPFAVPTVLDAGSSPFFFPAPTGLGYGYTIDLAQTTQPTVRELLHVRFKYQIAHIADAGSLTGPIPTASLAAQRNAHLGRLRADSGRADYGEPMPDLAASAA